MKANRHCLQENCAIGMWSEGTDGRKHMMMALFNDLLILILNLKYRTAMVLHKNAVYLMRRFTDIMINSLRALKLSFKITNRAHSNWLTAVVVTRPCFS